MMNFDALLVVFVTFLIAGTVKGIVGLGLPTVSLGVLTAVFDLTTAMAMLIVPSFITNFWQAVSGGYMRSLVVRHWRFFFMATVCILVGAQVLTRVNIGLLAGLLGFLLVVYGMSGFNGRQISIPSDREVWLGPLFGGANGVLTGMTGSFVVPGVMYLQGIGLPRDMLVQAMGILFTLSTASLAVALQGSGLFPQQLASVSAMAVFPAIVGMLLGRKIRHQLPESRFQQVFYFAVTVLGIYIVVNAAFVRS